jgi:molybdenum cofactor cytidylyltransferase
MGKQKLLLPFQGSTVLARVVDAFLGANIDQVLVVTPVGADDLRGALAGRPVQFVENPNASGDMLSSIRAGLQFLSPSARAVLICPGDLPLLEAALIREMLTAFHSSSRSILVPVHGNRRGHPLIMDPSLVPEVLTSFDGVGLRGLLEAHPEAIIDLPVPQEAVLRDLDTPEDYQQALDASERSR